MNLNFCALLSRQALCIKVNVSCLYFKTLPFLFFIILAVINPDYIKAQSLPVGTIALEDYYRRQQLLGNLDSTLSLSVRPLNSLYLNYTNRAGNDTSDVRYEQKPKTFAKGKGTISLLPFSMQFQFTSDHPYGWNDGALIPAKGIQTVLSAGVYVKYGPLSIQFKPEVGFAENTDFEDFTTDHYEIIWARYYDYYNNIDLPVRFGEKGYSKAYWGQSSVRLTFDPISFGLSTENLWWGPGMRNSLLMSNTAPGFKHLTLNTVRPIKSAIGTFEGQLIAGWPEESGFHPLTPDRMFFNYSLYNPKPTSQRYLSGLIITWQPKWVPGLFLGLTRSTQIYTKDMQGLGDYIPVFMPFSKIKADEGDNKRSRLSSMFFRWLWAEEHAEIYFEYGRNDHSYNLRDFVMNPENSRAYIFGLRKLFPYKGRLDEQIQVNLEVTQMQQTSVNTVRNAGAWYVDNYIRQGYTNRGEALGSGIGPGANLQSLEVSWVSGLKRIGLQLERYVHNNDFYYYAYEDSGDWRRHWIDLSASANGEWNYKNLIFNARLQMIKSLNYQWYLLQTDPNTYFIRGRDVLNVQAQVGITYRF